MEDLLTLSKKILSQTATIHIYSFPNFTLEIFLAIVMFIIYIYLTLEIAQIAKTAIKTRPNTIIRKKIKEVNSSLSICSSSFSKYQDTFNPHYEPIHPSTHLAYKRISSKCSSHSQLGWIMPNMVGVGSCTFPDLENSGNFDTVASMTPAEFVKKEKERRLREKELQKCFESLTSLYGSVIDRKYSVNTLQNKLELAKESVQCGKCNLGDIDVGLSAAMTDSLFDLLEKIVLPSSLNNPLPFNGDMTRLVLDAGDLNLNKQNCNDPTNDGVYERSSTSSTSSSEIIPIKINNNIASY
nr:uncharacterized protein LOC111422782 [Onthophagus taurus]XP_022913955.1 uncharacterized protein LOC111424589 [Onthophagus taurus]